ncbi:MAG: T9SS type A sorting domain-containing protein [Chitinophagales bacterium]
MKKCITLCTVLLSIFSFLHAQNPVPNSSFETWIDYGYYENPESWGTVNEFTWPFGGNSPFTVKKDSNSNGGVLAVKMVTIGYNNLAIPAVMCTGKISFSNFSCTGGFPISSGYANFSGYFKYSPFEDDTCVLFAMLTKWDAANSKRDTVAVSTFFAGSTPNYSYFSDSFNYHIAEIPDSAQVILSTTKNVFGAPLGSILLVDDISFSDAVGIDDLNYIGVKILPNPASDFLNIRLPTTFHHARFQLFDLLGMKIADLPLPDPQNSISVKSLPEGIFFCRVLSSGKLQASGKIVVKH